ncbi:MAG: dihydroorotase [Bacilli bacterium]|nr:dihydroorotase [Bacilli bacterium]
MSNKILIKNGYVIDIKNNIEGIYNIFIDNGIIVDINKNIDIKDKDITIINASNLFVIPGLVDTHCHLRDPGFLYKEDIKSGSKAAARGGFTSIACMPNTSPVVDNEETIDYVINKAREEAFVNVFPIGAITEGQAGKQLTNFQMMKNKGIVALSDDGYPVSNSIIMSEALKKAKDLNIKIISHTEDLSLSKDGVMNEGAISKKLSLKGIPSTAESTIVARDILLAEYHNAPIHIAHVSSKESVDIIRNAKKRDIKVTAETCPHYFSLTDKECLKNTMAKVNPPLKTKEDVKAIIKGLTDGTIDNIATDHAPHHLNEKSGNFNTSLNGISGFETALSVAITSLVKENILTMKDLVYKMAYKPACILGIDKGYLEKGKKADIAIVNINEEYIVDSSKFYSKGKNTPYDKSKLWGKVKYTIANGKIVYEDK